MYLQRQQEGVSVESQREREARGRARARASARARARDGVPAWWAVKTTVEITQCAHFLDFRER